MQIKMLFYANKFAHLQHRLSSITQADQIIYLENGKIIAQGNHQALLQTNAAYQTLWAEYQQAKSWTIH